MFASAVPRVSCMCIATASTGSASSARCDDVARVPRVSRRRSCRRARSGSSPSRGAASRSRSTPPGRPRLRTGSPRPSRRSRARACPASRAGPMVSSNAASVSAIVLLMFFLLCVSLALMKTAISFIPASFARSRPRAFGQSALKATRGRADGARAPSTNSASSSASASCGIHFGETKLVISIRASPAATSASMSRSLPESGTVAFSFCRPSRGDTS